MSQATIFDLIEPEVAGAIAPQPAPQPAATLEPMPDFKIRTLIDDKKHILSDDWMPNHFCSTAGEGKHKRPFLSQHHVRYGDRYIGVIWKDLESDPWSFQIAGGLTSRQEDDFDRALILLKQAWGDDEAFWRDFYKIGSKH